MINVTPIQIMALWEQLMQCMYKDNSFGTTVAEIYIYTMMPHSPIVAMNHTSKLAKEDYAEANQNLYKLCKIFEERNAVEVRFASGETIDLLIQTPEDPFTHRVHLEVMPK